MASNPQTPVQSWVIGHAPDCDLVVAQPSVSGHHCRLVRQGSNYWLEDLQSLNGTWVNGRRIAVGQPVLVEPESRITLGKLTPMPWPAARPASSAGQFAAPLPSRDNGLGAARIPAAPGARVITIGRSPDSTVQVDLPIVSWNHARIVVEGNQPILEDLNSRNGTAIDRIENRIQRAVLDPRSDVYLGSYKIAASQLLGPKKVEIGEAAFHKVSFTGNSMVIGRDPQCDLPLDYPMISWRHVRLTREADGILVEDLNSRNGTFVGGIRIAGKVLARPGQEIGLGSYRFQLLEGGELAQREYHGNMTIEAMDVVVNAPNGTRLIEPVSMTVFPSELVALMGPAGAGKTTLLKALNGYTKPAQGRVFFNGASLYDYYDRFRQQLGYVPQDDIVHSQLTVGEALYFSARLRTDLTESEIAARTVKVLDQLEMGDKIHTQIGSPERKTLSGGQRKRVNIALELINDTPVLFLDEPTSGLSSYDAESVIELLKDLSRQGKTIITTIHQPSTYIYKQFDDLIMVNRDKSGRPGANPSGSNPRTGTMVYFGPAYPDSIHFFNPELNSGLNSGQELSPELLLSGVDKKLSAEWARIYRASRYQRDFVDGRSGKQPPNTADRPAGDKPRRHFDLTQWFALVRRNYKVKLRDRAQTAILLLQAPLFALLISAIYHPVDVKNGFLDLMPKLGGAHFLMVIAAIWFGCNNAARDIVGEWTIYRRERMVTLKLTSYVFSKLAVLFTLSVFQCFALLGIVYLAMGLKSSFLLDWLVLVTASMVGAALGLTISASSRTTESAIALLPIALLPIIALGGGMRPIYLIDHRINWIAKAVPSRWAFEANVLHEARRDGWRKSEDQTALESLPDLGDPVQAQYDIAPAEPGSTARADEEACEHSTDESADPQATPQPDRQPGDRHHTLCRDTGEMSFPRYVIYWQNAEGAKKTSRAYKDEAKDAEGQPADGPDEASHEAKYKAIHNRESFAECMTWLGAMFTGLTLAVLGILLKRDSDPQ